MKSASSANSAPPAPTNQSEGEKKIINPELWQACAGPLVNLPAAGTHVVYFPQGHSEQVAASMKKDVDGQVPNYPNLPSKLLCLLHNVTLHADPETDEVYAQMTLQPVPSFDKEALLRSDLSLRVHKPQTEFFCKTLTASDTSTHGGFSVPRRAAEKIFPPLDYSMQPPAQELVARDLHDNAWTFRHIYRGQPKRHLLTTGWSLYVSGKRLFAGDSVLFIRDEKQQLLLGIRRANRQPTNLSSSVLSSDSMHIGILAAAAHAAANNSPFTVFYNPRASPSEFVIPLAKYYKAVYGQQVSLGMRFRMMFETEDSGTRRYMGTITGISDLDPVQWKNSQWRNLQVGWDESTAGERRTRVSVWEIEPVTAPFFICPPPFLGAKRPRPPGMPDDCCPDPLFKRTMPWLGEDPQALTGLSLVQWMNMQQNPSLGNSIQSNYMNSLPGSVLENLPGADVYRQLGYTAPQIPQQTNLQFSTQRPAQPLQRVDQLPKSSASLNHLGSVIQSAAQSQLPDVSQQMRANLVNQSPSFSQVPPQTVQNPSTLQQPSSLQNHQFQRNLSQQQALSQSQQQNLIAPQIPEQTTQPSQLSDSQIQLQILQRLQQQQSMLSQQATLQVPPQFTQIQDQQRPLLDVPQSFSKSTTPSQVLEMPQAQMTSFSQSHIVSQQIPKSNTQSHIQLSHPPLLSELQQQRVNMIPNQLPIPDTSNLTGGTDDIPSCLTSPSMNNCLDMGQTLVTSRPHQSNTIVEATLNPNGLETMLTNASAVKDMHQKVDVKPSVNVTKTRQCFQNVPSTQMDYLDTSSATSVSLSQNDVNLTQNYHLSNSPSALLRETSHEVDVHVDPSNGILTGTGSLVSDPSISKSVMGSGKNFSSNVSSGCKPGNYESSKDAQQELSSSMVTQSFGVPDIAFNSIDSAISDGSFMNQGTWAPPPQYQRMRTYTKVYKRGAVGRSIDVTRYSGYEELRQDLARMFGIEGQMEDRGRVGWKLVYVDHENDVLLVGDDPWEDFVNCVRFIKILSPQEVQRMSLDGDFANPSLPNQACSSSDGGNL